MKYASRYISALEYQKKVFDVIQAFPEWFETEDKSGYVFADNIKQNSIDIAIGSEKFTIISSISENGNIIFKVFGWEFDLSSLTRYSHLEIDKLCFIKSGNSLIFKYDQRIDRDEEYRLMIDFNNKYSPKNIEPLFNVIEDYIYNKDRYSPKAY